MKAVYVVKLVVIGDRYLPNLDRFGWQSIFLMNLPFCLVAGVLGLYLLPRAEATVRQAFDFQPRHQYVHHERRLPSLLSCVEPRGGDDLKSYVFNVAHQASTLLDVPG